MFHYEMTYIKYVRVICLSDMGYMLGMCMCHGGCVYVYIRGYAKILGYTLKVHVGPMCNLFIIHMSGIYVTYVI